MYLLRVSLMAAWRSCLVDGGGGGRGGGGEVGRGGWAGGGCGDGLEA